MSWPPNELCHWPIKHSAFNNRKGNDIFIDKSLEKLQLYLCTLRLITITIFENLCLWWLLPCITSPSFESSSVLHISPTDTPSMQNLILEGLQQKLQKSCSRCNKNTRHIESSYILQPPKYLLLFVNRFRYLNNNIIKDRCPIPLDATVMLGPLKFNLQATIDHHGPSIDSGHYTASINCCKKTFYCNDHKITEFGITDKNSSTAYIVLYKWIDTWFLDSNRRVGVWSLPWRWHILSIPLTTGRGTSAETCGLDDVFPPDDLGSRPETLLE